jgi:hypothetical protein
VRPLASEGAAGERHLRTRGGDARDCLDHVLVFGERRAERVLREYVRYYHGRPHRGLRTQPPVGARWLAPARPAASRELAATAVLGGLHYQYGFPAAEPLSPV